jgi:16S rRNA (uracil1498-N3)-methyltransferase
MSSPIFYIPPEEISGDDAALTGDELHHARTTLRLSRGDNVWFIDGVGGFFEARINSMGKDRAVLDILSRTVQTESPFALTAAMGIVKGERYEWAIQKGTELGITAFIPLVTERTEMKVRVPWKRLDRLQRIIISACKQCGRARFPILHEPLNLQDLDPGAFDLSVAFWEGPWTRPLTRLEKDLPPRGSCLMVVGPVGGLSSDEAKTLKNGGCFLASLGPRILRTETAVTAGASLLQYLFGDMK